MKVLWGTMFIGLNVLRILSMRGSSVLRVIPSETNYKIPGLGFRL